MKRLLKNRRLLLYIVTLQEAFTAIVPFFLLSSLITLAYFAVKYFQIDGALLNTKNLRLWMDAFNSFTSLAAVSAISYFFAERLSISRIMAVLLAMTTFLAVVLIEEPVFPVVLPYGFTPGALFVPIVSTKLLALFYPKLTLGLPLNDANKHIYRLFNYLFVYLAAFFATLLLYSAIDGVMDRLFDDLQVWMQGIPQLLEYLFRDFFVQISWYFGIHGAHLSNGLLGKALLSKTIAPHLSFAEFNRLFVVMGGAGVGVAMLIALLIHARERTYRLLARISIPFVLFNINTLMIYPIIVLNRFLFVPFVLLPLLNFLAGYLFLQWVPISFVDTYIPWTTPVLVNGYIKSGGDLRLLLFQLVLLSVDTLVYLHYLRKFFRAQSAEAHREILRKNLDIRGELKAGEGIHAYAADKEVIEANARLEELLPTLTEENLLIHYQPKIDVREGSCDRYEALIRYRRGDRLTGPHFLDIIERAGLAPIIDLWVAQRVKRDLSRWSKEGFEPELSVNLHPDTLLENAVVDFIIEELGGEKVVIEIIERSFLYGEEALSSLAKLQKAGFCISIDDFGVGYSNLETITRHQMSELKLDKALIDSVESKKGYLVCRKIVELCHEIDCRVVAEGVEREKQYRLLREMGVDFIQGYYFAPALSVEEAKEYARRFTLPSDQNEKCSGTKFTEQNP